MAIKLPGLNRASAMLKMKGAIKRGLTPTKFLSQLKLKGLGYRKQRFLHDWRNAAGIAYRKDTMKFARRDRPPPIAALAEVDYEMDEPYMYKLRVWTRENPDDPLREGYRNIQSKRSLSPEEQESRLRELWADQPDEYPEELVIVQAYEGYHRIEY